MSGSRTPGTRSRAHVWPPRLLLAGYAAALVLGLAPAGKALDVSDLLQVRGAEALLQTLRGLLEDALTWAARFLPLGLLAALSMAPNEGRLARAVNVWLPGLAIAAALSLVILAREAGRPWSWPSPPDALLPALGVLVGFWLGMSLRRGLKGLLGWIAKAAVAALVLAGLGAGYLYGSLESSPRQIDQPQVTSAEKRRLFGLFKGLHPSSLREGQTRTLRLSQRDLNLLLSWGLSLGSDARKARIETSTGSASVEASVRLPGGSFLNSLASGDVSVGDGALRIRARRLRLGSSETPGVLLDLASPGLSRLLERDRRVRPLAAAIQVIELSPEGVAVTYGRGELPPGFIADLFHGRDGREELPAVAAYVGHLLAVPRAEDKAARFARPVQEAFVLAARRSVAGSAVAENRAAILALAMLVGHPRVESFVGPVMSAEQRRDADRGHRGATLRGRGDWTQHFFVSAALTLLALESVSDATGLLKEELDAGGGSGFSFGDLLADRSGTTFASRATRDEASARALQARLGQGVNVEDIFPPADGLPEGIQEAELSSRYGGVGGPEYRRLVAEIEARIAACAAYR